MGPRQVPGQHPVSRPRIASRPPFFQDEDRSDQGPPDSLALTELIARRRWSLRVLGSRSLSPPPHHQTVVHEVCACSLAATDFVTGARNLNVLN